MKSLFNISLISAALLLVGCGDDSSSDLSGSATLEDYIEQSINSDATVKFTLQGGNASVPLANNILFDASDATLAIPTGGDDALTNPLAAMNTADGWSTSMPIIVDFEGIGLAPGAVASGVYLLQLSDRMTGSPTVSAVLTQNVDFAVVSNGTSLYITPLKPFAAASEYILAVTNEVMDKNGNGVGTSSSYGVLKSTQIQQQNESLQALQQLTQGIEGIFELVGVDRQSIVYSSWFSTHSVGETFFATKAATGVGLTGAGLNTVWSGSANPNDVDLSGAYVMSFGTPQSYTEALNGSQNFTDYINDDASAKTGLISSYGALSVNVTAGTVALPHYLEQGDAWNSAPFESALPSVALILNALSDESEQANMIAQLTQAGVDYTAFLADLTDPAAQAAAFSESLKLIGQDFTLTDGSVLDSERIITRYSPVPKVKSLQNVEFLFFTPPSPTGTTPVVIYQHGITSAKENAFAFAAGLAAQGVAVLAIDLPLHGSRSLDSQRSANAEVTAYLNLANLAVARDNFRQSVLDVVGLRMALGITAQAYAAAGAGVSSPLYGYDVTSPRMVGHSLGGIVGTTAVSAGNRETGEAALDALTAFSSVTIANAGGQIAPLLFGSEFFGPVVKHNLALASSDDYQAYASAVCASLDANACYSTFANSQDASLIALEAGLDSAFTQFSYAAQTVLDAVDPVTNAALIDENLPTLVIQSIDDPTVPNSVDNSRAGTVPLAGILGLAVQDIVAVSGTQGFAQISDAGHSTLVSPSGAEDLTQHGILQSLLADFVLDNQVDP